MSDKYLMNYKEVVFQNKALDFPTGQLIYDKCEKNHIPTSVIKRSTQQVDNDLTPQQKYNYAKKTLLVGLKASSKLETCKPSADFQLPLVSGCPGMCEYCYLHTRKGVSPTQKIYVNLDDIFRLADIEAVKKEFTTFELASTSDPLPFESFCGIVTEAIIHFSKLPNSKIRLSTKYDCVDSLINLEHNNCLEVRFSINAPSVALKYEHHVPTVENRIRAASSLGAAGYPIGFMIAPVFLFDGWQNEYRECLELASALTSHFKPTFEIITHRFTPYAKDTIKTIFTETELDMDETKRTFKMGQFGYGKYVYTKEQFQEVRYFFKQEISRLFGESVILYIV